MIEKETEFCQEDEMMIFPEDQILKFPMQKEMEPTLLLENFLQVEITLIFDLEEICLHLKMKADNLIGHLQVGGKVHHQLEEEVHLQGGNEIHLQGDEIHLQEVDGTRHQTEDETRHQTEDVTRHQTEDVTLHLIDGDLQQGEKDVHQLEVEVL